MPACSDSCQLCFGPRESLRDPRSTPDPRDGLGATAQPGRAPGSLFLYLGLPLVEQEQTPNNRCHLYPQRCEKWAVTQKINADRLILGTPGSAPEQSLALVGCCSCISPWARALPGHGVLLPQSCRAAPPQEAFPLLEPLFLCRKP